MLSIDFFFLVLVVVDLFSAWIWWKKTIDSIKKIKKKKDQEWSTKKNLFLKIFSLSCRLIYLFKFYRVILAAENCKVHHHLKPVFEFSPVLLVLGHYLADMSYALGNVGVELVVGNGNCDSILKNAQIEVAEVKDLSKRPSAGLQLVEVPLLKISIQRNQTRKTKHLPSHSRIF